MANTFFCALSSVNNVISGKCVQVSIVSESQFKHHKANTFLLTTYGTCMTSTLVESFIIIQYLLNYKTKINQIECELFSN